MLKSQLSLARLRYDEATCLVSYGSCKRGRERTMSALDFLAEMSVHVADRGQHQVLYFGYHSKRSRAELVEALAAGQTLAFVDLGVLFTESSSIAIKPYWA